MTIGIFVFLSTNRQWESNPSASRLSFLIFCHSRLFRGSSRSVDENLKSAKHTQLPAMAADCQIEQKQQHIRTTTPQLSGMATSMGNNCAATNSIDTRHHQIISDQEPPDGDETDPDVIPNQYGKFSVARHPCAHYVSGTAVSPMSTGTWKVVWSRRTQNKSRIWILWLGTQVDGNWRWSRVNNSLLSHATSTHWNRVKSKSKNIPITFGAEHHERQLNEKSNERRFRLRFSCNPHTHTFATSQPYSIYCCSFERSIASLWSCKHTATIAIRKVCAGECARTFDQF